MALGPEKILPSFLKTLMVKYHIRHPTCLLHC